MQCPFCKEEIKDEAIKCRYCHSMLNDGALALMAKQIERQAETKDSTLSHHPLPILTGSNNSNILANTATINVPEKIDHVSYSLAAQVASTSVTYESDYAAACLAVGDIINGARDFEAMFDKIVFHLDEAYKKCSDFETRRFVSRKVDELFCNHVYVIQARIFDENKKGWMLFLDRSKKAIISDSGIYPPEARFAQVAASKLPGLLDAYFDFMINRWEIREDEKYFYNQLANVYQKILDSKCYSSEFGLLRNTFTRNKDKVLKYVFENRGLIASMNLGQFDKTDAELQDTARIIGHQLIASSDWEKTVDFMKIIREKDLNNYDELKIDVLKSYEESLQLEVVFSKVKKGVGFVATYLLSFYIAIGSMIVSVFFIGPLCIPFGVIVFIFSIMFGYFNSKSKDKKRIKGIRLRLAQYESRL